MRIERRRWIGRHSINSLCVLLSITAILYAADQESKPAKPTAKAKKATTKKANSLKQSQRLFVQQGFYRSNDHVTDLTSRLQKAVTNNVLVVFVETSLSDNKKKPLGDFYVQVQIDGEVTEHKVGHRKFLYLDAREPAKIPPEGLVILDAWYGTGIWGEERMIDVKKELSDQIVKNSLKIDVKDLVKDITDPAPGMSKALIVRFAINGVPAIFLFEEHQTVEIGR